MKALTNVAFFKAKANLSELWAPACWNLCRPQERRRVVFNMTLSFERRSRCMVRLRGLALPRGPRSAYADALRESVHEGGSGDMRGGCGYSLYEMMSLPRALDLTARA
jgi:hypothetical protein